MDSLLFFLKKTLRPHSILCKYTISLVVISLVLKSMIPLFIEYSTELSFLS